MKLESPAFQHGAPIPPQFAFARPDPATRMALSDNRSPALTWSDVPEGTKSFVLLCHDSEVPTVADDVNKDDRRIAFDLPRADFYHWVLMDIAADERALAEGEGSAGIQPRGKPGPESAKGRRHGINDYTAWFAGDKEMAGSYFGYDGPCPPFNDTVIHPYTFTLYALDVARCPVEGVVDGRAVRQAIEGHILASAELTGTYSLAPDARAR
jgi:Raf kinase inhibitor-like YbhB/YbcL family protein